ncbi:MAG: ABC transporter ATP-binding protein [Candidatus Tectomicrobia bacterium]|nr:ABC transporter ATP-binding protein [Candidatus Tectomicrobia bacterium]
MLSVQDIHTYYGDSYILQGVSLEIPEGCVVSVLGRNGVGKTTLIRSIIGFTPPRRGRVLLRGQEITRLPAHKIARLGVGLVPQGRRIFASLTVRENLQVAQRDLEGGGRPWDWERVAAAFPRLRERSHHRGNKLSGGEQQMLTTARALMGNPRLLLMDEPSEGLAPLLVRNLGEIIADLKQHGLAILLVEQNLPFALALSDYVYVMSKGAIVHHGAAAEFHQHTEIKARYLGIG